MLHHLTAGDYKVMPWKNGGGTTTELYAEPDPAGGFLWRVSIAAITADGPFSLFEGYDRHIMALDGAGMILSRGPVGEIAVAPLFTPRSFSGDWTISARLTGGPVRDFNLIARRAALTSRLEVRTITGSPIVLSGEIRFLHVLRGTVDIVCAGVRHVLAANDSLLNIGETEVQLTSQGPPALAAACHIGKLRY